MFLKLSLAYPLLLAAALSQFARADEPCLSYDEKVLADIKGSSRVTAIIYRDAKVNHMCNGWFLNNEFLIAPASCVSKDGKKLDHTKVVVRNSFAEDPNADALEINPPTLHVKYDHNTKKNDLAVIQLKEKVKGWSKDSKALIQTLPLNVSMEWIALAVVPGKKKADKSKKDEEDTEDHPFKDYRNAFHIPDHNEMCTDEENTEFQKTLKEGYYCVASQEVTGVHGIPMGAIMVARNSTDKSTNVYGMRIDSVTPNNDEDLVPTAFLSLADYAPWLAEITKLDAQTLADVPKSSATKVGTAPLPTSITLSIVFVAWFVTYL
ncbi:hypothetical protein IWQ62_002737 [Dispira parvispora]|uniref:Peptidase S1 domain-containing protein n=1 Tax=Dispira parvispora TaxID=1520584 RepID=A0A9W8AQP7_9FUNG|nr:hypothetical protein IWQ62_002737 [Dispira parvispora]